MYALCVFLGGEGEGSVGVLLYMLLYSDEEDKDPSLTVSI